MPPRYAYWTIILDGAPTSFRTKEREEILPLFNQLRAKNPGAELKWFSGGKIWDSPDQAREARAVEKVRAFREQRSQQVKAEREGGEDPLAEFRKQHGRPADGSDDPSTRGGSERSLGAGPSTRPGPQDSLRAGPSTPPQADRRPWSPGSSPRPGPGQADPGAPKAPQGDRPFRPAAPRPDRRSKDWRPGGEHKIRATSPTAARRGAQALEGPQSRAAGPETVAPSPSAPNPLVPAARGASTSGPEGKPPFRPKPFGALRLAVGTTARSGQASPAAIGPGATALAGRNRSDRNRLLGTIESPWRPAMER